MEYELERCPSGGWKARFTAERYDEIRELIVERADVAVDTSNMMVFHVNQVKCSFVRSSGVMIVRCDEREEAVEVLDEILKETS